jgi:hypothetical protein
LSDTAAAQPGAGATYALLTFSNARSAPATTFALSGTWAQVALERNATTAKTNKKCLLLIGFNLLNNMVLVRLKRRRRSLISAQRFEQRENPGFGELTSI